MSKWKMKKTITLLLILFISFIFLVSSLKTFEVDETEKLSLEPEVEDPDADILTYTFTEPLDENGEWQTTYGDAGEYTATITVSDGVTEASEEVLIIVNRKEEKPIIDSFLPEDDSITIDESESIEFKVDASDLNNDELVYKWLVNGKVVSDSKEILFETSYDDAGEYIITLIVSDGIFDVSKEWNVNVNDVDINSILEQIKDIAVLETETASLELPNLKKYGLDYQISEPLGNNNKWKTDYDDAGEYVVKITAEGKGFKGEEEVKITVKNNDRAPKLVDLNNAKVKENEQLKIELKAVDPDDDGVIFSVEDAPENSGLSENVFTWTPGYDFVQKDNAFDYVLDKFRILGRSVNVVFTAKSNELSDEKKVKITVKDANRPFILGIIEDIEVNEGKEIIIDPKYDDPDKDKVSFSYSGFMNSNKKNTGYDDAGEYVVKIIATDGFHTETKFVNVKVNDVNRKPVFDKITNMEVFEGDEVKIELSASDPDNDAVSFLVEELPEGAKLKDNLFVWKPNFDVVNETEKEVSVNFIVSDGTDEDTQKVKITVLNVNQAPKIVDFSDNLIVLKGKPTLFEVNTVDGDDDELTYMWKFGFFDEYEDGNQHQRIFTTTGSKKVEVTVSDGIAIVSKVWNVEVV